MEESQECPTGAGHLSQLLRSHPSTKTRESFHHRLWRSSIEPLANLSCRFFLLLLLLPLYWPPSTRTQDQKRHTVQSPRVLGQLLKGDTTPRKPRGAPTMMFPSWADYLCGHEGADETNKCSSDLGEQFRRESISLDHLKGEEAILFMGIASDGSPLFLHHITELGSTRRDPNP
jgi:hypothetical protein